MIGGEDMRKWFQWLISVYNHKSKWISVFLPVLFLGVFFFFMTIQNVYSQTYDIERFDRAKETIRSPITIENEAETERKTRETILAVENRYNISEEITEERIEYIEEIFAAIENLETEHIDVEEDIENDSNDQEEDVEEEPIVPLTDHEKVQRLRQILSEEITDNISNDVFLQLLEAPQEDREKGLHLLTDAIESVMTKG